MRFKLRTDSDVLACMATEHASECEALRLAKLRVLEGGADNAVVLSPDGDLLYSVYRFSSTGRVEMSDYRAGVESVVG